MSDLKQQIIDALKGNCADLVAFGPVERFKDSKIPLIFPDTKTVIAIGFRVLRGCYRGIEEGTTYYQYTTMGVETIEETVMPRAMLRACSILEENGFQALPQKRNQTVMQENGSTNPEIYYGEIYRGKTPENQFDFNDAAVKCGLAELGMSGQLLTDEFGPLVRVCFILTDAVFEPTPVITPHLCDRCGKCVKACPGHAIAEDGTLDRWQCAAYYVGAYMAKNPFMPPNAYFDDPERLAIIAGEAHLTPEHAKQIIDQSFFYPSIKHGYRSSICGRACDMACYMHLEEKGVLTRTFKTPFRKRPEWKLPVIIAPNESLKDS